MSSYQYRNCHYRYKTASRPIHIYLEITIPGKNIFILRRGNGRHFSCQYGAVGRCCTRICTNLPNPASSIDRGSVFSIDHTSTCGYTNKGISENLGSCISNDILNDVTSSVQICRQLWLHTWNKNIYPTLVSTTPAHDLTLLNVNGVFRYHNDQIPVLYTGQVLDKLWWLLFGVIPCFLKIYGKREIYRIITNSYRPWQVLTLGNAAMCAVSYETRAWRCSGFLHCVCIIIWYWVRVIHSPCSSRSYFQ